MDATSKRIIKLYIIHLCSRYLCPAEGVYNQLPIWLQRFIKLNNGKELFVFLQCDSYNCFLCLYVGLPIARYVGKLTILISICDGHHYKTASFTVFSLDFPPKTDTEILSCWHFLSSPLKTCDILVGLLSVASITDYK